MGISVIEFFVIPYVTSALYLLLYVKRASVLDRLRRIQNPRIRNVLPLLNEFKLKLGDWRYTLLLFPLIVIALDVLLGWIYQRPLKPYEFPLPVAAVTSGFAAPIFESIVGQGVFIGAPLVLVEVKSTRRGWSDKKRQLVLRVVIVSAVLLAAFFMAIQHPPPANDPRTFEFATRFVGFVLFGFFYVATNRNLMPPIIAHAAANWFLIIKEGLGV